MSTASEPVKQLIEKSETLKQLLEKYRLFQEPVLNFPNGKAGIGISKILMQQIHTEDEQQRGIKVWNACLGHPTLNASIYFCKAATQYWDIRYKVMGEYVATELLNPDPTFNPIVNVKQTQKNLAFKIKEHQTILNKISIDEYQLAEKLLAEAFNNLFQLQNFKNFKFEINEQHVVAVIGGTGGIDAVFSCIAGWFATVVPDYVLYPKDRILPIETQAKDDYRFTAEALEKTIINAEKENYPLGALLICNPHNPMGFILTRAEWKAIVNLIAPKKFHIIIDNAYGGMGDFSNDPSPNFLQYILSELNNLEGDKNTNPTEKEKYKNILIQILERTVLMETGTKTLSVSGERTGALIVLDPKLRKSIRERVQQIAPASYSLKMHYAISLKCFSLSWIERCFLREYHKCQVEYVAKKFQEMGLGLSKTYSPQGTFYVVGNFKFLMGYEIKHDELLEKLKARGLPLKNNRISTDLEMVYFLLFKYHVSLPALSYFSGNPHNGLIRITCSGGPDILNPILQQLQKAIEEVESHKKSTSIASQKTAEDKPLNSLQSQSPPKGAFSERSPNANSNRVTLTLLTNPDVASTNSPPWKYSCPTPCKTTQAKLLTVGTRTSPIMQFKPLLLPTTTGNTIFGTNTRHFSFRSYIKCAEICCEQLRTYWNNIYTKSEEVQLIKEAVFKDLSESSYQKACKDQDEITRIVEKTPAFKDFFPIIAQIVRKAAAIDYGAVDGDAINIDSTLESISYFLDTKMLTKDNIVFYGGSTTPLLTLVFADKKFINSTEIKEKAASLSLYGAVVFNQHDLRDYSDSELTALGKILSQNPHLYIIFEDFMLNFMGRDANDNPLIKIIQYLPEKMIILSQSAACFIGNNENISFFVLPDESLKPKFLTRITNLQVHAPRSLQFALAKTVYELMNLSKREKKIEAEIIDVPPTQYSSYKAAHLIDIARTGAQIGNNLPNSRVEVLHSGLPSPNTPIDPGKSRMEILHSGLSNSNTPAAALSFPNNPPAVYTTPPSVVRRIGGPAISATNTDSPSAAVPLQLIGVDSLSCLPSSPVSGQDSPVLRTDSRCSNSSSASTTGASSPDTSKSATPVRAIIARSAPTTPSTPPSNSPKLSFERVSIGNGRKRPNAKCNRILFSSIPHIEGNLGHSNNSNPHARSQSVNFERPPNAGQEKVNLAKLREDLYKECAESMGEVPVLLPNQSVKSMVRNILPIPVPSPSLLFTPLISGLSGGKATVVMATAAPSPINPLSLQTRPPLHPGLNQQPMK